MVSVSWLVSTSLVRIVRLGGHHSSVDLPAPTCLWSQVRIPSTPSTLFSTVVKFCTTFLIELRKGRKNKKRPGLAQLKKELQVCTRTFEKTSVPSVSFLAIHYTRDAMFAFDSVRRIIRDVRTMYSSSWSQVLFSWFGNPVFCRVLE